MSVGAGGMATASAGATGMADGALGAGATRPASMAGMIPAGMSATQALKQKLGIKN